MIVEFDKSFEKSLNKIKDQSLFSKLEKIILNFEEAITLQELPNIKKLSGYKNYYRIRIGNYRLGFEKISENTIRFIIVSHRKDIYDQFP